MNIFIHFGKYKTRDAALGDYTVVTILFEETVRMRMCVAHSLLSHDLMLELKRLFYCQ